MSPIIALIVAAFLLILLQFIIGTRGSLETRRIYTYLLNDARKRARRTFTAVVMLDRRAETIYPLLDHLYEQGYEKLQILVVIKQTAGSRAMGELQAYKRQNRRKGLKVVRHQKRMDHAKAAALFGTGEYVIPLVSSNRLSPRFFEVSSQVLSALRPHSLAVRSIVRPSHTFKHAFWALISLVRTVLATGSTRLLPSELRITKRKPRKNSDETPLVYASSQFYSLEPSNARFVLSWRVLLVAIVAGVLALGSYIAMSMLLDVALANLYIWIIIGTVEVAAVLCMLQVRGYRLVDFINLLLFIPIAPMYATGYSIIRIFRSGISVLRRPRLSAQR